MQPEIPEHSDHLHQQTTPAADPNVAETGHPEAAAPADAATVAQTVPDINKELVLLTFAGMAQHSDAYHQLYQLYEQQHSPANFNRLQNHMLDAFPSILSAHIRDLFTPERQRFDRDRLEEMSEVYLTLTHLLSTVTLANLVTAVNSRKNQEQPISLNEEERKAFRHFLEMSETEAGYFDYLYLAITAGQIMQRHDIEPYLEEMVNFHQWFRDGSEYHEAYHFMEARLRNRLRAPALTQPEIKKLAEEGSYHLGKLLQLCSFLTSYQLVTVKDLSVYHPKSSSEPIFVHSMSVLKGRDLANIAREPAPQQRFDSNNSIFILRNNAPENPALNLSPFMIDENAFRRKKNFLPKIYFYNGMQDGKIHYQHAETLSYRFLLDSQYDRIAYRDLDLLFQQLAFFRSLIGI